MLVLGLESSCDETSIALLNKETILANNTYTQSIHATYGGVVPEIASRAHIEKIDRLCLSVLNQLGIRGNEIQLLAVTDSPGLAGALLVGISFTLGIHCRYNIPVTGVNHLEGHMASVLLEHPKIPHPFLALVVSGGHTAIYQVEDIGVYRCLGKTIDDAAGEAFDKIGKLLGFAYPAGRQIEQEALKHTTGECISFPIARLSTSDLDFSFSGLKTSVKYYVEALDPQIIQSQLPLLCFSFQKVIIESLVRNICAASEKTGIDTIALVGGVACNGALRKALKKQFGENVFFPSPVFCTDNAAMIAKAGYENYLRGRHRFPSMSPSGSL